MELEIAAIIFLRNFLTRARIRSLKYRWGKYVRESIHFKLSQGCRGNDDYATFWVDLEKCLYFFLL